MAPKRAFFRRNPVSEPARDLSLLLLGSFSCKATRSSLLTGKHAARLGLAHFVLLSNQPASLPLDEVTLPDRLRALGADLGVRYVSAKKEDFACLNNMARFSGYATHCVGKWHLGFARSAWLPTVPRASALIQREYSARG